MKTSGIFTIMLLFLLTFSIYPQTTHIVHANNYSFIDSVITITKGDTVKWVWDEGMHTTTSDSTSGVDVWNAPLDASHTTFSFVFSSPGVHHYYCVYHISLGMTGTITVQEPTSVILNNPQPDNFSLEQNYPNPFNPSTKIKYSIAKDGFVNLEVYNILGNKMKTLVNQKQNAGSHSIEFKAGDLPSGIYFYRIETEGYTASRKMILLK
jgi:plastocyanin